MAAEATEVTEATVSTRSNGETEDHRECPADQRRQRELIIRDSCRPLVEPNIDDPSDFVSVAPFLRVDPVPSDNSVSQFGVGL